MMLFIFVPVVVLVGWLLYEALSPTGTTVPGVPAPKTDPMGVVKYRYARGEIDKKEYDRLKKDLS